MKSNVELEMRSSQQGKLDMSTEDVECVLNRLKALFSAKTDTALAKALNVPKTTLSSWKQRGAVPYLICVQVAEQREVSLDWLLTGKEIVRSMSDSEIASNRTSSQDSINESNSYYESDTNGTNRGECPIRHGPKQAEFLEFMARLTPEQQDHVLEIIKESAQLNALKAKVAELEAKLNVLQTKCPESALPAK